MKNGYKIHRWTDADKAWLRKNFQKFTAAELAAHLGVTTAAAKRKAYEMKLAKTDKALAKIYAKPNAGQFKSGALPLNTLSDGEITVRETKGKFSKWIRLSLKEWQQLHHYNWIQAGNTIPKGYVLAFIDKNPLNCELPNLELITRGENLSRNSNRKPKSADPEKEARREQRRAQREAQSAAKAEKLRSRELARQKAIAEATAKRLERRERRPARRVSAEPGVPTVKCLKIKVAKVRQPKAKKQVTEAEVLAKAKARELKQLVKAKIKAKLAHEDFKKQREQEAKNVFKTRKIDTAVLIALKIDQNTTIWIKPGQDPEAIRTKILNRNNNRDNTHL